MTVQKDNIYEFGFGRSDQVSKNVNLLDEAVFSFLYGGCLLYTSDAADD